MTSKVAEKLDSILNALGSIAIVAIGLFACGSPLGVLSPLQLKRSTLSRPIIKDHELLIRDLLVVEDPARTLEFCDLTNSVDPRPWSFEALITQAAEQAGADDPSAFVLRWLETWETDQTVSGWRVPARTRIRPILTEPWLEVSGGSTLDLRKAPFRLAAIVNRLDLREMEGDRVLNAGEARFVFNAIDLLDHDCRRLDFTLIFEYQLPAHSQDEVVAWAQRWHALGDYSDFSGDFNAALQAITDSFTPFLNQVRTNEEAVTFVDWEQRSFALSPQGDLVLRALDQTPDLSLNGTPTLATFINDHAAEILKEVHHVPDEQLGGFVLENPVWDAPDIDHLEVRHHFGIKTCSGCHNHETGTRNVHIFPRRNHEIADLSDYMTGDNMPILDPYDQPRSFNELQRRADDLQSLIP